MQGYKLGICAILKYAFQYSLYFFSQKQPHDRCRPMR